MSNQSWVKESDFWMSLFDVRTNPTLFLATLDPAGNGATAPAPVVLPPGFTFHAAAVSFSTAGVVALGELTDAVPMVVQ